MPATQLQRENERGGAPHLPWLHPLRSPCPPLTLQRARGRPLDDLQFTMDAAFNAAS